MRKLIVLLALLCACGEEETQLAATQITLTVQAEPALRGKLDNLRATLFLNAGGSWTQRSSVDVAAAKLRWPFDLPILARPEDESAQIEVILEAFAGGQRLAQGRVVTRFIKDRVALIASNLFECTGRAPGFVCAQDSCHGEGCEVCSISGDCIAVVPMATEDAGTPQPRQDAATSSSDAGAAPQDATTPPVQPPGEDASTPPPVDAGPTPTVCPENACVAPYLCIPTPAGYTCRGQMADWPMPDKLPSSKTKPSYTATPDLVTDNVTKLQWQIGAPRIYPGCTEYYNIGSGKSDTGELCTRAQARDYCENLKHATFEDWRLPTVIEVSSLFDFSTSRAYAIDGAAFADTDYGVYVTDSTYAGAPGQVWTINYYLNQTYYGASASGKVRCVRAGGVPTFATPKDRYLVDGERVTDQATTLIWQRTAANTKFASEPPDSDEDAGVPLPLVTTACSAPWRLPTSNELLSLIDYGKSNPAIDTVAFPNAPSESFWGSAGKTTYNNMERDEFYLVDFENGMLTSYGDEGYVRCVQ